MKIITIAALVVLPFLFGCTSTTVKTYSADFKVYPIEIEDVRKTATASQVITYVIPTETEDAGKMATASNDATYVNPQYYKFESVVTETIQNGSEETTSRDYETSITSPLGEKAMFSIGMDGNKNSLEAKIEDTGPEYIAYFKATISREGEDPIVCSQTVAIQK